MIHLCSKVDPKLVSTESHQHLFNTNNLSFLEVKEEKSNKPKVMNHLVEKAETISDLDFLKEDMFNNPKFMIDPSK